MDSKLKSKVSAELQPGVEAAEEELPALASPEPSAHGIAHHEESYTTLRRKQHLKDKQGIARYVAWKLVEPTKSIFLDAGSTVLEIATEIFSRDVTGLTIMTNNMEVFNGFLGRRTGRTPMTLISTGGEYDRDHDALFGLQAVTALNSFYPHMVVIGTSGFSFKRGVFYHGYSNEGVIKEAVLRKQTSVRVIVCDYSKIGQTDSFLCGTEDWLYKGAERCIVVTTVVPESTPADVRNKHEKCFEEERGHLIDLNRRVTKDGGPPIELVRVDQNGEEIDRV